MKKLSFIFVLLFSALCLVGCHKAVELPDVDGAKNLVILIGDGMGKNHIENAKKYFGEEMSFEKYYYGDVTTFSLNSSVTDSAAAATALAIGTKVNNNVVAKKGSKNLETIMDIAKKKNKKTGIITSDELYGATPACYSSHAASRHDTDKIVRGQASSGIDLFIGPVGNGTYGAEHYAPEFERYQYSLLDDYKSLSGLEKSEKALVTLPSLRSLYNEEEENQVDFVSVVRYALNFLENENGFCLMIEDAYIDKCSHENDLYGALCEVKTLSDIFSEVDEYSKKSDTAIILTADHETGGLQLVGSDNKFENSLYTTTSHTGANVDLYMKNVGLDGEKTVDNTYVFLICRGVIENKNAKEDDEAA